MESLDYWRLCDGFSLSDAAILIIGEDPSNFESGNENKTESKFRYNTVTTALAFAVKAEKLKAELTFVKEEYCEHENDQVDCYRTTVLVDDLREWLSSRNFTTGFFFPQAEEESDYLDQKHENYAPKLAAAIRAWQAVNADPALSVGVTVKQGLLKWLRKNADRFGLTKDDGSPNEQGIEEIAKIANWDSKGGAPKTPG